MTTIDGEYFPSPTPKAHPRVKPEAASNAERNRGNMERWFDYSGNENYDSPRPAGRSVTNEGKANAAQNRGCMNEIMGGYANPPVQRNIHPRAVKGDALEIATQNKGGAMKDIIDNYGKMNVNEASNGPKVHGGDALEYAERNHGTVNTLMNNYGNLTPEQAPPQKVSYGGEEVAAKHTGAGMGPLLRMEGEKTPQEPKQRPLHQQSQGAGWDEDPPAVRTRPEAEDIADKQSSEVVGNLMRGEVAPPTERDPKLQPHMATSVTPRPQSSPLRTKPEAMHNYQKNRQSTEMNAILHGESTPKQQPKKANRMMQRSELW